MRLTVSALGVACACSCATLQWRPSELKPMSSEGLLRKIEPQTPKYNLSPFVPGPAEIRWFESPDFYPKDAVKILAADFPVPGIIDSPRFSSPTAERLSSPTTSASLSCDTIQGAGGTSYRLVLSKPEERFIFPVYFSQESFDAIWSPDGVKFVICHERPPRSSFTVYGITSMAASSIELNFDTLRKYLPPHLTEGIAYAKPRGWVDESFILVRVLGRSAVPPVEEFGLELLIGSTSQPENRDERLVRGFTRVPEDGEKTK